MDKIKIKNIDEITRSLYKDLGKRIKFQLFLNRYFICLNKELICYTPDARSSKAAITTYITTNLSQLNIQIGEEYNV